MTAHSKLYIRLIAVNLYRQLKLPCPSDDDIRDMYNSDYPQPIVMSGRNGTVWLDPLYAAFCLPGGSVTYVYVSKQHIFEELRAHRLRRHLPLEIRRQFRRALMYMKDTGSDAWVETRDFAALAFEGRNIHDRHENHGA